MLKSMKMPVGLSWIFHNYILDHLDRMIESLYFVDFQISSLLFGDDVVLLAWL